MSRARLLVCGRLVLGAVFVVAGVTKALHPAAFLLDLLQYPLAGGHFPVWVAALLPWMEIVFGGALLVNRSAQGAAMILLGLLLGFTGLVLWRAQAVHAVSGVSYLSLVLNCGCGMGPERLVVKLAENLALAALALWLMVGPRARHGPHGTN